MRAGVVAVAVSMLVCSSARAADKAGYVLLDKMVTQFDRMAHASPGLGAEISSALDEMMALAKKAQAEKRIDETFFRRYTRVLMVMRLVIMDDPQGILVPLAEQQFSAFVKDTTGASGEGKPAVAELAKAIAQELDNLKSYLDAR
jgi:hypothetical protein